VQDAYSMRSAPQVIGAAHDAIAWARSQVEIELNGVGDNPIFFPEDKLQLTGANFQGSPVSLPMDMAGTAITMVSVMSERRMNRLNHPALPTPVDTRGGGPGGLRFHGDEHRAEEPADSGQRLRDSWDRIHGGGTGIGLPRFSVWGWSNESKGSDS